MIRLRPVMLVAILSVVTFCSPARAGWLNEAGRLLGVGWSDGYHAQGDCPTPNRKSIPWTRRGNFNGGAPSPAYPAGVFKSAETPVLPTPARRAAPGTAAPSPRAHAAPALPSQQFAPEVP